MGGCQENDPSESQAEPSLAEVRLRLASLSDHSNLITRIDYENQTCRIHFESGDTLKLRAQWIQAIIYDSADWLVTFRFHDNEIQVAYFLGELAFDRDNVLINPYFNSPLAGLVNIKTPVDGKFRVSVKGKAPDGISIGKTFDYLGQEHVLPLLGLYEDHANEVEFVFMNRDHKVRYSKTLLIKTSAIADGPALEWEVKVDHIPPVYNGLYFVSNLKMEVDQRGEIRWYYSGEGAMFFGKTRNGNFILADSGNLGFFEVTMLGQQVKKYDVPHGLHHEIFEKPDGNFLVASHSPPGPPYEDVVVEISRSSGEVTKSWDFNTILDRERKPLPDTRFGDWLHINALYYDHTDATIVVSGRSQSAVVKVDYETRAIKWILSNPNGWPPRFTPYLLKPIDNAGAPLDVGNLNFWSYGQHGIHRLSNGNLLLYDNGDYRGFYDDESVPQSSYSRLAEYRINETDMTVALVWSFDNGKSVFTKFTGYAQDLKQTRLAAYMFASENTPKIIEVGYDKKVAYEATINRARASYYRTFKIDLFK